MTLRSYLVSSLMLSLVSVSAMASSVEVLHWWTAGGEAKAAGVLRSYWQALGNGGRIPPFPVVAVNQP